MPTTRRIIGPSTIAGEFFGRVNGSFPGLGIAALCKGFGPQAPCEDVACDLGRRHAVPPAKPDDIITEIVLQPHLPHTPHKADASPALGASGPLQQVDQAK